MSTRICRVERSRDISNYSQKRNSWRFLDCASLRSEWEDREGVRQNQVTHGQQHRFALTLLHARTGTEAVRSSLPQLTHAPFTPRKIAFQIQ